MKGSRGFSLIELLIGTVVAAVVIGVFLSIFQSSYRYAATTRDRSVAIVLGRSLLDEVEAHPYGSPQPQGWERSEEPALIWIEGRPVKMQFAKKVSYLNGSFIGKSKGDEDFDVVTIVLSWREAGGARLPASKQMRLAVPVWR